MPETPKYALRRDASPEVKGRFIGTKEHPVER
jgi:hypothetical protein